MSTAHDLFDSCRDLAAGLAITAHVSEWVIPLDDLVHEAFVGLAHAANTYKAELAGFSTHAYWKVRESVQAARRQQRLELPRGQRRPLVDVPDREISPFEFVSRDDLWKHLTKGLRLRERIVLRLLFQEDMNGEDVGEVLSISREAVRLIKEKALTRIRQRLFCKADQLCEE